MGHVLRVDRRENIDRESVSYPDVLDDESSIDNVRTSNGVRDQPVNREVFTEDTTVELRCARSNVPDLHTASERAVHVECVELEPVDNHVIDDYCI